MEHETQQVTGYEELERALASVPGIVSATVRISDETGSGRLRIRLAPGEDRDAVSWAVAATLRERFGITLDPEAIRPRIGGGTEDTDEGRPQDPCAMLRGELLGPRLGPDVQDDGMRPAAAFEVRQTDPSETDAVAPLGAAVIGGDLASSSDARVRAAIRDLVTQHGDRDVEVTATLEVAGTRGCGEARALPTRRGVWRAVAEATLGALGELAGERLQAGVDRVTITANDEPAVASVVVTLLSDRGEETLLGASLVRDDPENAVMRATLDALNRRVEPWLPRPVGSA